MIFFNILRKARVIFPMPIGVWHFVSAIKARFKGVSIGVRVAVFDENGAVFLVRHSYVRGWFMPGGGVDAGEATVDAAARELREETGIASRSTPDMVGIFLQKRPFWSDYVVLYLVKDWEWDDRRLVDGEDGSADGEILEGRFFDKDSLPEDVSPATLRRLDEIWQGQDPSLYW